MKRRVSYEEYLSAAAMTFARRHRPLWRQRRCACGADLPCHATHRIPISREHWPTEHEQTDQERSKKEQNEEEPA